MKEIKDFSAVVDGKMVVNTTPHPINYVNQKDEMIVISSSVEEGEKTSPWLVNAKAVEETVAEDLVQTKFVGTPEGLAILDKIEEWGRQQCIDNLKIVGSLVAAQAYPGRVVAMCPAPGYERVSPAEKRMTASKFTVYPSQPEVFLVGYVWYASDQDQWPNFDNFPERICFSLDEAEAEYELRAQKNQKTGVGFIEAYLVRYCSNGKFELLRGRYRL